MNIDFFDDPARRPRSREDVRLNSVGIYVHEGSRRLSLGFNMTPFIERPSVEVDILNADGLRAGAVSVIQTPEANFHLNTFLRDKDVSAEYKMTVILYYSAMEEGLPRTIADQHTVTFDARQPGETIIEL